MSLAFHVSHVRVEVQCELDWLVQAMQRVWAPCLEPVRPPLRTERFRVQPDGDGFVICHGEQVERAPQPLDVLPVLEGSIYRALRTWHAELTLLHGACVHDGGRALLLLGASGAGKSSLALAALRAGWGYATDELVVFDGECLWGVPRALQFDVLVDSAQLPERLADLDRQSYRMLVRPGMPGAVPLFVPAPAQVLRGTLPAAAVWPVLIDRGEPRCESVGSLQALAALHEACFGAARHDLGPLLHNGALVLDWTHPAAALEALRARLAAAPRLSPAGSLP